MGQPATASSVVTVPLQARATSAAAMASRRPSASRMTCARKGQPAARAATWSATVGAGAITTCSDGRSCASLARASSNGGIRRATSELRLPGSTSRIGSPGPAPIRSLSRAPSPWGTSSARAGCLTKVTSAPAASNSGLSKAMIESRRSKYRASDLARPGRVAQACGATYLTSGRSGLTRRRRRARR